MKRLASISLILLLFLSFSPLYAQNDQTPTYDYSSVSSSFSFTRDLTVGSRDQSGNPDVSYLQCILGINPSGYFGNVTKQTLIQFQNDHAEAILTPNGLTSGTGYFGPSTRDYINQQIATDGSDTGSCTPPAPGNIGSNSGGGNVGGSGSGSNGGSGGGSSSGGSPSGQQSQQQPLPQQPFFLPNGGIGYGGSQYGQNGYNSPQGSGQQYPTRQTPTALTPTQAPTPNPTQTPTQTKTSSSNNENFFGGTVTYNSLIDKNGNVNTDWLRPCSKSEPNTYLVIDDNKSSSFSGAPKPIFLLVKLGYTQINGSPLTAGAYPPEGMCITGLYLKNDPPADLQNLCQDYTRDGETAQATVWPIHGLIQNFSQSPAGSCRSTGGVTVSP